MLGSDFYFLQIVQVLIGSECVQFFVQTGSNTALHFSNVSQKKRQSSNNSKPVHWKLNPLSRKKINDRNVDMYILLST